MNRFFVSIFFSLFLFFSAKAQQTAIYLDPEKGYRLAVKLFDKAKYAAAQKEFDYAFKTEGISEEARSSSAYYAAVCAAMLQNADAEERLLEFIEAFPVSSHYNDGVFALTKLYYEQKKWKKAIEWFPKIDTNVLTEEQKDEFNYKLGYTYYRSNDFDHANQSFALVKDGNSRYAPASQYYYAHSMYMSGNYETALTSFMKLKDNEGFAPVIPFYVAQIYFKQGKYDELLAYAVPLYENMNVDVKKNLAAQYTNGLEIERMIAEAYYKKKDYAKALPYLKDYVTNSGGVTRTDYYQLGFLYTQANDCKQALPMFQRVTNKGDTLSQFAYYHLASCFLKEGNKQSARSAFQSAAKMDFDNVIKEESKFNYAKLSYELNFQNVALQSFRDFIAAYPKSTYLTEANELIVSIYASTKNYRDALNAIEKAGPMTQNMKSVYQRVAYYRGVEVFLDGNSSEAIALFTMSLKYPVDKNLQASAQYWKGEAQYKQSSFDDAITSYNEFLYNSAAASTSFYALANYNLGYSYFKKEDFNNAQNQFRKYIQDKPADKNRYDDALLRLGDSYFMLKDYANALDYYNMAIDNNARSKDYALYEKSVLLGIQNKGGDKVATLNKILAGSPKSPYFDDALYESANANMTAGNNEQALTNYQRIVKDYPNSSYVKKALLGQGLVYYNMKRDEDAMRVYKTLISKYPNTAESKEAMIQLKNIAVTQNKVEEYVAYVKTVPNSDVSANAQDSLLYEAAELRYTQGNCDDAAKDFDNYLQKFPNGYFRANATYYKADCQFRNKKYAEALEGYNYIIELPKNSFTEKSLLNAAIINYRLNQYDNALQDFEKLEAVAEVKDNIEASQAGQMRSAFKVNQYEKAISNAQKVIATATDKDLLNEAHLILAKSALAKDDLATAKKEFEIVVKRTNSAMTAEANYNLALIEYKLGNYKQSKELVLKLTHITPSYDYWIAKGFILLGDDYVAMADTFQAKETYKSIVTNYQRDPSDPDDLRAIASQKLSALTSAEESQEREMRKPEQMESDSTEMEIKK
jgi:TolA-binding protein